MNKILGRPKKAKTKDTKITTRFGEDEFGMILDVSMDTGENYSDIIRKAVRYWYRFGYRRKE